MLCEKPTRIDDARLTPNLNRVRSGSNQVFYTQNNQDKLFTIIPPEPHFYAELIDGHWYWINGCDECNDREPKYCYVKCEKHDVCVVCGISRKDLIVGGPETPWGGSRGITCSSCYEKQHNKEKEEALAATGEYDPWDFHNLDTLTCPYCKYEFQDDFELVSEKETSIECPRCDNEFTYQCEYKIDWTMSQRPTK